MMKFRCLLLPLLVLVGVCAAQGAGQGIDLDDPFLRYPDVCGKRIVFSHAGDLWIQDAPGAQARRLTSHPGPEYFAKFSPDCGQVAFTGRIDGDDQVYVMSAAGGVARRLTGEPARKALPARWGSDNQVLGWSPDGRAVLFRSLRESPMISHSNLYTVELETGVITPVGMVRAGMGVLSPDGTQVLYSPWSRDFRTWAHYRGGWAQDLWIFDRASQQARQLSKTTATERDPMWTAQGMFFLSDRNGRMNLFRHDPASGEDTQLTQHKDDAMWASADRDGNIVYEVLGRIWRYDPQTGQSAQQRIRVPSDLTQATPRLLSFADAVERSLPMPDGAHALVVARGDVFVVGTGEGAVRALTASSDAHEREAAVSADGQQVAFISDQTGEEELWVVATEGGTARQVTHDQRNRFSRPRWSPDGKSIAMSGKDGAIYLVGVASGALREVGRSGSVSVTEHVFSPDGRYLAWTRIGANQMGQVQILDIAAGKTFAASDAHFHTRAPAFSPDGNYLYALSERAFSSQMQGREWNFQIPRARSLVVTPLRANLPDPFAGAPPEAPAPPSAITFDSVSARVMRTPVPAADIDGFTITADDIVYAATSGERSFQIGAYSFKHKTVRILDERVDGYVFNPSSAHAILYKERNVSLLDPATGKTQPLATARMGGVIDPRLEWRTVFDEVCRRYRDFFYVPDMHGYDWPALCARYRQELPRIASRGDLTELMGRMLSELNVGHAYIDGRDAWQPDLPASAALGAALTFDVARQRWRIERIYPGDAVDAQYRSPLGVPGTRVREGDWLLAVDGHRLDARHDPWLWLRGKAESEVTLELARDGVSAPWRITVKPVASQEALIYRAWSERNREQVERLSGGRIGYLHIPSMSPQGYAEFARDYFNQIRKDGLIVDIRGNTGGSGSPLILDRLARPFVSTGQIQGREHPTTYPWGGFTQVFTGERALLINEATMSDGDTMAWAWQQMQLGPIYGKRTWGGTVGTGFTGALLDGTTTNVPQYALAGSDGAWVVEGEGVVPDVDIGFDAEARLGADDPQLAESVRLLLMQMSGHPGTLPKGAPGPDKRVRADE